jgi:regulator of protease activity HflC (stomatin/prohibitin superfamily)
LEQFASLIGILIILIFVFAVVGLSIKLVPQNRVYIIERLGKYHTTLEAGIHLIVPFIDRIAAVHDLRILQLDMPKQPVITKDNVSMGIDSYIFYQIVDAKMATYGIANYAAGILNLTVSAMRQVVGELELDEVLGSRDKINARLRETLDQATANWGIRIDRIELKDVQPPQDIQDAMEKQMRAERNKRATILEAQGEKESAILKAEGERESQIRRAEGEKEANILYGQGQAEQIRLIAEAERMRIEQLKAAGLDENVLVYKSYEALSEISKGDANKVFLPVGAADSLASVGAIAEVFKKK